MKYVHITFNHIFTSRWIIPYMNSIWLIKLNFVIIEFYPYSLFFWIILNCTLSFFSFAVLNYVLNFCFITLIFFKSLIISSLLGESIPLKITTRKIDIKGMISNNVIIIFFFIYPPISTISLLLILNNYRFYSYFIIKLLKKILFMLFITI